MSEFKIAYTIEFLEWIEDTYTPHVENNTTYYIGKTNGKFHTREQLIDHWFTLTNHK